MAKLEVPEQVLKDLWVAEYALLLIGHCHFGLAEAISMGEAALENICADMDDYPPSEAVLDEIEAMRANC